MDIELDRAAKALARIKRVEQQKIDAELAWIDYYESQAATRAKTVRLRQLRLARDAARKRGGSREKIKARTPVASKGTAGRLSPGSTPGAVSRQRR